MTELNSRQKEAIEHTKGPLRIIAGPGSGKTRTLTEKVRKILSDNLAAPEEILVITFTNRAASEIKERIQSSLNIVFNSVYTYHGWCAWFLRNEAKRIGISSDYRIIDADDQKSIIKEVMNEYSIEEEEAIDEKPVEVLNMFSEILLSDTVAFDKGYNKEIKKLYDRYVVKKQEMNSFDFNDLLLQVRKALSNYPEVKEFYKDKYKYILIDEFQDTNNIQYEIVKEITRRDSNITVVGDPDQNIYSWRGANIDIILNFDKDYDDVKTVILEDNYRSTPQILEASNNLINRNEYRVSFDIKPVKGPGPSIKVIEGNSRLYEAYKIVDEVTKLNVIQNIPLNEIAVIFRSAFVTRDLEAVLVSKNIPYKLIGGFKFFERKEVKEVLTFLHFLVKGDDYSFKRIINIPSKGIGPKTISNFEKTARGKGWTIWEAIDSGEIKTPAKLEEFIDHVRFAKERINIIGQAGDVLRDFLEKIGYIDYYFENEDKIGNIDSIISQINYQFKNKPVKEHITDFFNNVALLSSSDAKTTKGQLTLITGHASKGSEFEAVILMGVNEGILPSSRAKTIKEFEEERRIMYVAMTRAKRFLTITYALGYNYTGMENRPSSFLNDLNIAVSKEYNNIVSEIEVPDGYTEDNSNVRSGSEIYHKSFGKGIVIDTSDSTIVVAFKPSIGTKELLIGHKSYFLKK